MKAFNVFKVVDIAMAYLTFEFKDWFIATFDGEYEDRSEILHEDLFSIENVMEAVRSMNEENPNGIKEQYLSFLSEIELCCKQNKCDYFRIVNE